MRGLRPNSASGMGTVSTLAGKTISSLKVRVLTAPSSSSAHFPFSGSRNLNDPFFWSRSSMKVMTTPQVGQGKECFCISLWPICVRVMIFEPHETQVIGLRTAYRKINLLM